MGAGLIAPAVRLLGASEALREANVAPIPITDRASYDELVAQARDEIGEDAFAASWKEGRRMGRDEAVAAALALCDAVAERRRQEDAMAMAVTGEGVSRP